MTKHDDDDVGDDVIRRREMAYQTRKLAEAWWKLAEDLERGIDCVFLRARLLALDGISVQAVRVLDAALSVEK